MHVSGNAEKQERSKELHTAMWVANTYKQKEITSKNDHLISWQPKIG